MEKCKKYLFSENASFILAFTGFVVLISTITLFFVNFGSFTSKIDSDKLDHFGSFIGGLVGAMWSLASFILLYVSLQQQKEDVKLTNEALRLQIEEFRLQQKELEGTKIALEEQGKTQELQRFETTFFNLLEFHNQVVRNLNLNADKEGFDFLSSFYHNHFRGQPLERIRLIIKNNNEYSKILPYFEYIENVFEYIWNSKIKDKQFYANLLMSQLNDYRIQLILTYCTQKDNFKSLIYNINSLNNRFQKFPLFNELYDIKHNIKNLEPILD